MRTFSFLILVSILLVSAVALLKPAIEPPPETERAAASDTTPPIPNANKAAIAPLMQGTINPSVFYRAGSSRQGTGVMPLNGGEEAETSSVAASSEEENANGRPVVGEPAEAFRRSRRWEFSGSYNRRTPYENYGAPKILTVGYFQTASPTFNFFGELSAHDWKEGQALFLSSGFNKDWTSWLYTFTSGGVGTNSTFLPRYRLDQDFNFKFGPAKNFVFTLGAAYVRYFDVHKDAILASGLAWYYRSWVFDYRFSRVKSDPGEILSSNHIFGITQGYEGRRWTSLTVSSGSQGYIATTVAPQENVYANVFSIEGRHRQWVGKNWGLFVYAHYEEVSQAFIERGATLGGFYEY